MPRRTEPGEEAGPCADQELAPPRRRHRTCTDLVASSDEKTAHKCADHADAAGQEIRSRTQRRHGTPVEVPANVATLEESAGERRADGRQHRRRDARRHISTRHHELVHEDGAGDREAKKGRQRTGGAGKRGFALV